MHRKVETSLFVNNEIEEDRLYERVCQPLVRHLSGSGGQCSVALVLVDCFGAFARNCLQQLADDWWADPEVDCVTATITTGNASRNIEDAAEFIRLLQEAVTRSSEEEIVKVVVNMAFADRSSDKVFILLVVLDGGMALEGGREQVKAALQDTSSGPFQDAEKVHIVLGCTSDKHRSEIFQEVLMWRQVTLTREEDEITQVAEGAQLLVNQLSASVAEATSAALRASRNADRPKLTPERNFRSPFAHRSPPSLQEAPDSSPAGRLIRPADLATDRLCYAQTLRRMMISASERDEFLRIVYLLHAGLLRAVDHSLRSSVAGVETLMAELQELLKDRDDALIDLLQAKSAELASITPAPEVHVEAADFPTSVASRRRTLSGASVPNDSISSTPARVRSGTVAETQTHQFVPGNVAVLPEWHRHILASGGNQEIDQRRRQLTDPAKAPQMRVSAIQKESLAWRSFSSDLDDYRRMCAFEIFLVGEPNSGKSSVAWCMTNPVPRFFKKPPAVPGPTIVATTTTHVINVPKTPQLAVPHGGMDLPTMSDMSRLLRDQTGAASFGVRITELPVPVLRASALPGVLPSKGCVYFLLYDLRERRDVARRAVEAAVKHIAGLASSVSSLAAGGAVLPFVLIGTHRDEIPELNLPNDQSPVQSLLRAQRDWFEGLLRSIDEQKQLPLVLLDSFAVSCAHWTVTGERPQSSSTFESLLHDTVSYLSVSAPCNPQHLLPTAACLLNDDEHYSSQSLLSADPSRRQRFTNTVDQFWAQHGQNRSRSKPPSLSSAVEEQVQRWLLDSAVGCVTFFTSLARCCDFSTTVCDAQTLSNALLQHFELTVDQSEATEELLRLRNCIIEHFLAQCRIRGIIYRIVTSRPADETQTKMCTLRGSWIFSTLSCALLPASLQYHSDLPAASPETQKQLARSGPRSAQQLLLHASQSLGIANVAANPSLLQSYKLGLAPLQLLQAICGRHLRPAFSSMETAATVVRSLGLGDAVEALRSYPHTHQGPSSLASFIFVPAVAKKASLGLLNIVGYVAQVVSDAMLVGRLTVPCGPLNLVSAIAWHLASQDFLLGEVTAFYSYQNALLIGTIKDWTILVEDPEQPGILKCVTGVRGTEKLEEQASAAFASISGIVSQACSAYEAHCVAVTEHVVESQSVNTSPEAWADSESNLRTLVYQAAADAAQAPGQVSDRVLSCVRKMVEHTADTQLSSLMAALEELW